MADWLCGRNHADWVSTGSRPKAGAAVTEEVVAEILRRRDEARHQLAAEAGHDALFQHRLDPLTVGLGHRRPVLATREVRHGGPARRSNRAPGGRGCRRWRSAGGGRGSHRRRAPSGRRCRPAIRGSGARAGSCGGRRRESAASCRNTRRTGPSRTWTGRGRRGLQRRGSGRSRAWVRAESAFDTTMAAGMVSPLASVTPVASPRSMRISATSAPSRTRPPWPRINRTRPSTRRPVPPMTKCTPQRRSRSAIRQ